MESSDDRSYLQVHLWCSTSRKMTYPLFLFATFYLSGAVCGVARLSGCRQVVARMSPGCRQGHIFAPLRLLNCPCAVQGWPNPNSAAPIESLDMSNSKYVSHSPIDEHLKRAEPRTVSFPPFRGIGPPTHLLGVGRVNLTTQNTAVLSNAYQNNLCDPVNTVQNG